MVAGFKRVDHREQMDIPDSGGAYVSYVGPGNSPALVQMIDAMHGVDASGGETALVVPDGSNYTFLILTGDWRAHYLDAVVKGGFQACLDLFRDNRDEHKFATSDDLEDLPQ